MWYSGGEQYEPNAIGYATSPDGLAWTKHAKQPGLHRRPIDRLGAGPSDGLPGGEARRLAT